MPSLAFPGVDHRFYDAYTLSSCSAVHDIVAVIDYVRSTLAEPSS